MDLDTTNGSGKRGEVIPIFTSERPLEWGALDLPMLGLAQDWDGEVLEPAPAYSLACDADSLWFVAHHRAPARAHPESRPGGFQAELWKYDVAELFLADPGSGRYVEFNLAPNSAWWSCEFTGPRNRAEAVDIAFPDVQTWADLSPDGAWVAAMAIPLDILRARIDFGGQTRGNVCMILESPAQRFLTATRLGSATPDFHRPDEFGQIALQSLTDIGWAR